MNKKTLRLFTLVFILFISASSKAQEESSEILLDPAVSLHETLSFEIPAKKREKAVIGTLKFQVRKMMAFLEFEGRDLKRGIYELVKTEGCSDLKKDYSKNRHPASSETLYVFTTEYGDFSGEKNLNVPLESLKLESSEVALVKVTKGKRDLITCGKREAQIQEKGT